MRPSKAFIIEPSKFRYRVSFFQEASIPDGMGGFTVQLEEVVQTWAAKAEARTSVSYNDLLEIAAGKALEERDIELYIRFRPDFFPAKDIRMKIDNQTYLLTNPGTTIGEPARYVRVVGKLQK
ncbi:head-tail joining protein [Pontibacter mucosus]|uniref:Head-tail joining protein n=1 Tax=Pontibacter mucosus TaxID=1649266 RepID=A0A2T5YD70_9BACT|nr:head-tail adaptor protein [Pontibacter mucosus]PTX14454.1 head-tail joining protein [Pontibacter mucosus]